jgi:hypothetical protein
LIENRRSATGLVALFLLLGGSAILLLRRAA